MSADRFRPELLVEQACETTGLDNFGESDTWRDGLHRLCEGLVADARLNALGVEIAAMDISRALTSRLQII
ncbi:sulfotransferase, partial [Mycobacterium sp. ITM-2017-0098]